MAVKTLQLRIRADKSGPEPPRNVPNDDGNLPNPELAANALLEPWPLLHAELMAPAPKSMDIPEKTVARGLQAGWASIEKDEIHFHLEKDDLIYKITRWPDDAQHDYACKLVTA